MDWTPVERLCLHFYVRGPAPLTAIVSPPDPVNPGNEITLDQLLGRWRHIAGSLVLDWIYRVDGTFAGNVTRRTGKHISDCTGKWWLEGRTLISVYESDSSGYVDVGYKDRDTILELESEHFLVQTTGGPKRRFTRVQ